MTPPIQAPNAAQPVVRVLSLVRGLLTGMGDNVFAELFRTVGLLFVLVLCSVFSGCVQITASYVERWQPTATSTPRATESLPTATGTTPPTATATLAPRPSPSPWPSATPVLCSGLTPPKQMPPESLWLHTVQPGETLWSIAALYDTPLDELIGANEPYYPSLQEPGGQDCIFPGWRIVVPR